MISSVVVSDGRAIPVFYDNTHQQLLGTCGKFSQTAIVVLKHSFRN